MKFSRLLMILYQKLKKAFQMALEMIGDDKIQVEDMLTHRFPLEDYRKMIEVNMTKTANRAIKTAVSFE